MFGHLITCLLERQSYFLHLIHLPEIVVPGVWQEELSRPDLQPGLVVAGLKLLMSWSPKVFSLAHRLGWLWHSMEPMIVVL